MNIFRALVISVLATFLFTTQIVAQVSEGKFIGSFQTIRQVLDDGRFSCQAIQCGASCGQGRVFILLGTAKDKYVVPIYNHIFSVAPGAKAKMVIGKQSFELVNREKKPSKVLSPADGRTLVGIVRAMLALEKVNRSGKFQIIDPKGNKRQFSVRGTKAVLKEFNLECKTSLKGY
ncbi:MAG: hypothetical protein GXP05_04775 [Alphaproteobacteria bacterium]|nr:hypothetical protein [Alphaproteobacteria bacterium]